MTAPGGSVGRAYISFHAETGKLEPELEAALRRASDDADQFLDGTGQRWGNTVSDSMSNEIEHHGHDFARSIEHSLAGEVIQLGGARFKVDRRGMLHDFDTGRFAGKIVDDIEQAFQKASSPGGPLSQVGQGIADAIGAGFNVSGKSPLIALLIPTFGAIAAAIVVVVQAANALAAVLVTLPALVTSLGLQVGVLALAFSGVGTAIQGAFAAKNWNDFYAAIQGLTPAAQNFIVTLLPLRDLFRELKTSVQESFFSGFGNTMVNVVQQLGPILRSGLPMIASALGEMFKNIGLFFASPTFVQFVSNVIPATLRWLGQFGPGFVSFLTAIVNMSNAALPFLQQIGDVLTSSFAMFTSWLNEQVQSGTFTKWLGDMAQTLESVKNLFFAISGFVVSFLGALDQAGGNDVIDQFTALFGSLSQFFSSEAGIAAMEGFIHLIEMLTFSFSGLIYTLMGLLIAFEAVLEFFAFLGTGIQAFVDWLTGPAADAIGTFFTETFPEWASGLATSVSEWFEKIGYYIKTGFGIAIDWIKSKWDEFVDWFDSKVEDVVGFFTGLPDRLRQIGTDLMDGLMEGLQWGWDHTVKPVLDAITNAIPDWKGPREKDLRLLKPAGKAIMMGFKAGLTDGAGEVKDLLTGLTNSVQMRASAVNNNTFNSNLNFFGQQPTEAQAQAAGRAVAGELDSQIASRDVQLAVRML